MERVHLRSRVARQEMAEYITTRFTYISPVEVMP